jgi:4-diphosphocytidyl-2-C-methyl-D-erythritol kinase
MLFDQFADDLVVWAPAKVNLYLELHGKRADGYHELTTLMVAVRLYDTLVMKESDGLRLSCSHAELSSGPDNLVLRAARLLQQETGCQRGAVIRLIKRIPLAAGLAGGSTDAAATLAGLNRLWRLALDRSRLADLAARLGSDVPFFLYGPAAWCTGRGERVEPLTLGGTLHFVLVCPRTGLSTAAVYGAVGQDAVGQDAVGQDSNPAKAPPVVEERQDRNPAPQETAIRAALAAGRIEDIGGLLHNRLQPAAEKLCPAIARIHAQLAELEPAGVLMSGSGSTVFALCRSRNEANSIAHQLSHGKIEEDLRVYRVRSCS